MKKEVVEILLVEDNPDDAVLTIRALKKQNLDHHLLHLSDGEQALDYLFSPPLSQLPKLILLDLKMPKVDGIEVLKKIKSDDSLKIVPVVVLTSSREENDVTAAYKLGANAYVVKPVDFDEFVTAISGMGSFWLELNEPPT